MRQVVTLTGKLITLHKVLCVVKHFELSVDINRISLYEENIPCYMLIYTLCIKLFWFRIAIYKLQNMGLIFKLHLHLLLFKIFIIGKVSNESAPINMQIFSRHIVWTNWNVHFVEATYRLHRTAWFIYLKWNTKSC